MVEMNFKNHTIDENGPTPMRFIQGTAAKSTDGTIFEVMPTTSGGSFKYTSETDTLELDNVLCSCYKKVDGIVQSMGVMQVSGVYHGPGSEIRRNFRKNLL